MGMSGSGGLNRFFLGSTSRDMVEKGKVSLLLIPPHTVYKEIEKIAIATDLRSADIDVLHSLAGFARYYNAEILVFHITDTKNEVQEQNHVTRFLEDVTCKINYPKIYYRHVKSMDVDHGLQWITEHGQIDMLAMIHRRHGFLHNIFSESHALELMEYIDIPLLVFPDAGSDTLLPVFEK